MASGRTPICRRKTRDYRYTHMASIGSYPDGHPIPCRVRVYEPESEGGMPVVVISNVGYGITHDIEYIAAEVMLQEYPEKATSARKGRQWFVLVEHYPRYSELPYRSRELFSTVKFVDWRPRVGWWPVRRRRRVRRVLSRNTIPYNRRVYFSSPDWKHLSLRQVSDLIGLARR